MVTMGCPAMAVPQEHLQTVDELTALLFIGKLFLLSCQLKSGDDLQVS